MEGYKPPFTITNSILSYVASISEKVGRITVMNNMENKPHLRRNNRIKSIHSSLKIEANSLSLSQVRELPLPKEQAFATVVLLPFVVLLSDNRSQKRNKLPDCLPAQYHFCHRFSLWQP